MGELGFMLTVYSVAEIGVLAFVFDEFAVLGIYLGEKACSVEVNWGVFQKQVSCL